MNQSEVAQLVQFTVAGGTLSHSIDSAMPCAIVPHAVVCADFAASFCVSADAFAQLRAPLKATQTLHETFCAWMVD